MELELGMPLNLGAGRTQNAPQQTSMPTGLPFQSEQFRFRFGKEATMDSIEAVVANQNALNANLLKIASGRRFLFRT